MREREVDLPARIHAVGVLDLPPDPMRASDVLLMAALIVPAPIGHGILVALADTRALFGSKRLEKR